MENLQQDIELLSRDYSIFRHSYKWCAFRVSALSAEADSVPSSYVKILRTSASILDCYSISSLEKRQELKRSTALLTEIQKLWLRINPANFRAISKQVYSVIIELLYRQFPQAFTNPSIVPINLQKDSEIDFKNKSSLTFTEFYDIFFDVIDNLCKSSLLSEYLRLVFLNKINLLNSSEFLALNLFSKIHLNDSKRLSFQPWMQKVCRFITPEKKVKLPEIGKNSSAPKFLNREKIRNLKENVKNKWEFRKLPEKKRSINRSISPIQVKKSQSYRKIELPKKNPLSVTPTKFRKRQFLLEQIIEEREKNSFRKLLV